MKLQSGKNGINPDKDFVFNDTKGFYCLSATGCLSPSKGHKGKEELFSEDLRAKLADFLRPHNQELFKMIGRTFDWD